MDDLTLSMTDRLSDPLSAVSSRIMQDQAGMEGGYYFLYYDAFFGYAWPTSIPPLPVYGPPPRSYNIIREQVRRSALTDSLLAELHSFDAATFPLATQPVYYQGKPVGAAWARIHIENDLPVIRLKQTMYVIAIITGIGFIILMIIALVWAGELKGINSELRKLHGNPHYRLLQRWGVFTTISQSINHMLDTIEAEDNKRKALEKRLIQKEKMASLGRVIAGVAHEVKTPLTIIKTRVQIWQKEIDKHPDLSDHISRESSDMMLKEINRLASLVDRLLIFSRPIDKNLKKANLNDMLEDVLRFLNYENEGSKVKVVRNFTADPLIVEVDENSIKQVLINIINNSYESMPQGGKLRVATRLVQEDNGIEIEISDQGTGIPEDALEEIFVPFYTLKDGGVGLGLAISEQIIKAHNGEIILQNKQEGPGVECRIVLPLKQ